MEDIELDQMTLGGAGDDGQILPKVDPDSGTARIIVLAATYGEGEPTDNSTALVEELKQAMSDGEDGNNGESKNDSDSSSLFKGIDFTVFGLGNRQYEHYNAMGKFFDESFQKLGGNRIFRIGLGDDDADLEGDFESWKEAMWTELKSKYLGDGVSFEPPRQLSSEKLPDCEYAIEYHDDKNIIKTHSESMSVPLDQVHGSSRHYFQSYDCPVTAIRELRSPEDGGSTVHIEIDISMAKDLTYRTADNFGVLGVNDIKIVESVAESLGYDLDAVFSLKGARGNEWHGAPFPMPITIRECLTRYCDLTSAPRRSDLKLLAQYATDGVDRQCLTRLSSKEGKKEYKEKIMDGYVGMVDLLKLCPSVSMPLEHFISVCHFNLPRFYTISSSSSVHPDSVHLTAAVTEAKRPDGSMFRGVCSTHLASLRPGKDTVRVFNRPSTFRLPDDSSRPIILIGPGTGIAPMRALLQERRHHRQVQKQNIGRNVLYFGCKKKSLDYLYKEELEKFQSDGILDELHLAFSREQNDKVYVQHLLSKNAEDTWSLINDGVASIYVCGGVKMGHDVTEALKEIVSTQGQMSVTDAKDYLAKLSSDGRYIQELWA